MQADTVLERYLRVLPLNWQASGRKTEIHWPDFNFWDLKAQPQWPTCSNRPLLQIVPLPVTKHSNTYIYRGHTFSNHKRLPVKLISDGSPVWVSIVIQALEPALPLLILLWCSRVSSCHLGKKSQVNPVSDTVQNGTRLVFMITTVV